MLDKINKKKILSNCTELEPNEILAICRTFRENMDIFYANKAQKAGSSGAQANQASPAKKKSRKNRLGAAVNAVCRSQTQQPEFLAATAAATKAARRWLGRKSGRARKPG